MRTSSNDVGVLTYPESVFFTKGKDAYVKFQFKSGRRGEEIALTIIAGGEKIFTLNRISNAVGTVVINVCDLLEALFAERAISYAVDWRFMIDYPFEDDDWDLGGEDYQPFVCNFDLIMAGYSDREWNPSITHNVYPFPGRIVLYPNFEGTIPIFAPLPHKYITAFIRNVKTGERRGASVNTADYPPFTVIKPMSVIASVFEGGLTQIEIADRYTFANLLTLDCDIDPCTKGIFLKWVDKHGIPYLYRWSPETSVEEIDEEDIIVQLDDTMHPIERRTKTITQEYTLHSRRVEQDIFDLCKSVIGCRELAMYNRDTGLWEPCFISDSQAEDNGDILKDLVVTVSKYEYL